MTYEVKGGELRVNGLAVPLGRGLILLALARAGWKGHDGLLSEELASRLLQVDPRIDVTLKRLLAGGVPSQERVAAERSGSGTVRAAS